MLLYRLGLVSEVEEATHKILEDALGVQDDILKDVYMPFLSRLYQELNKAAGLHSPHSKLHRRILSTFISKCKSIRPRPSQNWSRRTRECGCSDCELLDTFFTSPTRLELDFYERLADRNHLEWCLSRGIRNGEIQSVTLRQRKRYILRIAKVPKLYNEQLAEWKKKHDSFKKAISDLGTERLRSLLGEHYETIMSLRPIQFQVQSSPSALQIFDLTAES